MTSTIRKHTPQAPRVRAGWFGAQVAGARARVAQEKQGYIGIFGATVRDEVNELYGLPKGVFISRVVEGSPAEKYGLKDGDIITHFAGREITSWEELLRRIAFYSAGEEVEITLIRGDAISGYREMEVKLVLGKRPD